jgi:hypothetical protein
MARRVIELFNRNFGQGRFEVDDDVRAIYAEEPIIVPFRAALEGTRYEGPGALDEFAAASAETWSWIRIAPDSVRDLGQGRALIGGILTGVGRESGAEVTTRVAFLIEVEEGRIAAARTFPSEEAALEAVGR